MYQDVRTMNIAYGKPAFEPGVVHWDKLQSQCKNIGDEQEELLVAINKNDRIEMRDAVCDILVFTLGACHFLDQDIDSMVAFEGFEIVDRTYSSGELLAYARGIRRDYYRLMGAIVAKDLPEVHEDLADLTAGALAFAQLIGQDIFADMKVVFESNMSKFCANPETLHETVQKYHALGVQVYLDGDYPTIAVKSTVDQTVDGVSYPAHKVLKPVTYKKPVFA